MTTPFHDATDATFAADVLEVPGTVLVDFWEPACLPCQAQDTVLGPFAAAHPHVRVVKVDISQNPALRDRYGVFSVPTLAVFRDGALVTGAVGAQGEDALAFLVSQDAPEDDSPEPPAPSSETFEV